MNQQTYDLNTQELIEAAKALLEFVKNIGDVSFKDLTLAWGRLHKAVEVMELQEREEPQNEPTTT